MKKKKEKRKKNVFGASEGKVDETTTRARQRQAQRPFRPPVASRRRRGRAGVEAGGGEGVARQ